MRLDNLHRRYCFAAIYLLAVRDCLYTGVSAHDSVFDFSPSFFKVGLERGRPLSATCDPLGCPS